MFSGKSEVEIIHRGNEVIRRVDLKDANNKLPSEISGGMKKRVAIARAIVLNPKYLFCDEPNSGLDPKTAIIICLLYTSDAARRSTLCRSRWSPYH